MLVEADNRRAVLGVCDACESYRNGALGRKYNEHVYPDLSIEEENDAFKVLFTWIARETLSFTPRRESSRACGAVRLVRAHHGSSSKGKKSCLEQMKIPGCHNEERFLERRNRHPHKRRGVSESSDQIHVSGAVMRTLCMYINPCEIIGVFHHDRVVNRRS